MNQLGFIAAERLNQFVGICQDWFESCGLKQQWTGGKAALSMFKLLLALFVHVAQMCQKLGVKQWPLILCLIQRGEHTHPLVPYFTHHSHILGHNEASGGFFLSRSLLFLAVVCVFGEQHECF